MTGPSSERTADADVATIRVVLERLPDSLYPSDRPHPSGRLRVHQGEEPLAALDRLVARNQQLQEALERQLAKERHNADDAAEIGDNHSHSVHGYCALQIEMLLAGLGDAALASVRASLVREPRKNPDVPNRGGTPSSSDPDLGGASPEGNDGVRGAADAREGCAKLIDAKVAPLLESGSLPPMWPWWLPLVDAIAERLKDEPEMDASVRARTP